MRSVVCRATWLYGGEPWYLYGYRACKHARWLPRFGCVLSHPCLDPFQALAAWTGYGCDFHNHAAFQWHFELSAQAVAPLLLLVVSWWLLESPRWLAEHDREDEALAILKDLHPPGKHYFCRERAYSDVAADRSGQSHAEAGRRLSVSMSSKLCVLVLLILLGRDASRSAERLRQGHQ